MSSNNDWLLFCFGPFVFTADKGLICSQYAVCCFWPDHLLRKTSKIEETLECGADRLPLINSDCHLLKADEHIGKECTAWFLWLHVFKRKSLLLCCIKLLCITRFPVSRTCEGKEKEIRVKWQVSQTLTQITLTLHLLLCFIQLLVPTKITNSCVLCLYAIWCSFWL